MTWTETDKVIAGAKLKNTTGWIAELRSNIEEAADYNSIDKTQLLHMSMALDNDKASSRNYIRAYQSINSISEALVCGADKAGNYTTRYSSHKNSVNNSNQTGDKSGNKGQQWSTDYGTHKDSHWMYCYSENDSDYGTHYWSNNTSKWGPNDTSFDGTVTH